MEIEIAGHKHPCLLDTGCDFSLVPRRLILDVRLTSVDLDIYAANGAQIAVLGKVRLKFRVQGMPMSADLLVSDDIHKFMLGIDWLDKYKAV